MTQDTVNVQRGVTSAGADFDTYVLAAPLIDAGATITISDSGANKIQLIGGLEITASQVASTALLLTLSNGATVTILDAQNYTFETGGNPLFGTPGVEYTFETFTQAALGVAVPGSGIVTGGSVSINTDGTLDTGEVVEEGVYTLTTSRDVPVLTLDDDVISGRATDLDDDDVIADQSTADSDVMNLDINTDMTGITAGDKTADIVNIETLNAKFQFLASKSVLDMSRFSGTDTINILQGGAGVTLATIAEASTGTFVPVSAVNKLVIDGTKASSDSITISANHGVRAKFGETKALENLSFIGTGTLTLDKDTDAAAVGDMKNPLSSLSIGGGTVRMSADSADKLPVTGTGTLDLAADGTAAVDLTDVDTAILIKLSKDATAGGDVTVANGAQLEIAGDQSTNAITAADGSSITVTLTADLTGKAGLKFDDGTNQVGVTLSASGGGDLAGKGVTLDADATLTLTGSGDLDLGTVTAGAIASTALTGDVKVKTGDIEDITLGSGSDEITLTAVTDINWNGGDGVDTVVFPAGSKDFTSKSVVFTSIEVLDIGGAGTVKVDGDVLSGQSLSVKGDAATDILNVKAEAGGETIDLSGITGDGTIVLQLVGVTGNEVLTGSLLSATTITGGKGADTMVGGNEDDTFILSTKTDFGVGEIITGGAGKDTLSIAAAVTSGSIDLTTGTVRSIEVLKVGAGVDVAVDAEMGLTSVTVGGTQQFTVVSGSARNFESSAEATAGAVNTVGEWHFATDTLTFVYDLAVGPVEITFSTSTTAAVSVAGDIELTF